VFEWTWKIAQWPLVIALVATALGLLNYFGPDAEQDWAWISPGALLATVLWLVASLAFKVYVANFADYNQTYGSLGGIIVLMLWFYLSGLAILIGAEMNAEIEHASPHGKNPGEKVPGERKKLGARAARAYAQARTGQTPASSPPATPVSSPVTPSTDAAVHPRPRVSLLLLYLVTSWFRRRRAARTRQP
jgi:membrane protein